MRSAQALAVLIAGGCTGAAGCGDNIAASEQVGFQLVVGTKPLALEAPTKVLVELLVVGATGPTVTVSSPNLPAFATLSGVTLTLDVQYKDVGDYAIELDASDGVNATTDTLNLQVTRTNTGPYWLPSPYWISGTGGNPPQLRAPACDKEGDNFTIEVVVGPTTMPTLPTTPQFTTFVDFTITPPLSYEPGMSCVDRFVDLPGLPSGQDYYGAIRAYDVLGAPSDGWLQPSGYFTVN